MDLAKGEGVAMSCHSGKWLNVHWKWNSFKSVDDFVEHYNARMALRCSNDLRNNCNCIAVTLS